MSVYPPLEWQKQCSLFLFIVKTCDAEQNVPGGHLTAFASSESFSVQVFPVTLPSWSDCTARVPPSPLCPHTKGSAFIFDSPKCLPICWHSPVPNTSQCCFDLCSWIHIFFLISVPLGLSFIGTQF